MTTSGNPVVVKKTAGHTSTITGSLLKVSYPQYTEWVGTQELYPFFFQSDSDWTVDLCAQVPAGYSIVGVQDELGNLISTTNCVQSFVNGEMKVVLFEVTKTGSPPEWNFHANIKAKDPKGRVHALDVDVPSVAKAKAAAPAKERAPALQPTGGFVLSPQMYNFILVFGTLAGLALIAFFPRRKS